MVKVNDNKEIVLKVLRDSKDYYGLSLTDLVEKTKMSRCKIRDAISFLLGAEKITETRIGMSKLYKVVGK